MPVNAMLMVLSMLGATTTASPMLSHLQELGDDYWSHAIAVAPVTTQAPLDALRTTMAYFESLSDSASTPLFMFLSESDTPLSSDGGATDACLEQLRNLEGGRQPRWLVLSKIDTIETQDAAGIAFWRETSWIWSGPTTQFCFPKTSVTIRATLTMLHVASGNLLTEVEVIEVGEREGPMIRVTSQEGVLRCASGASLHAKAKGQALRQIGHRLAQEADRMLAKAMFSDR